MSLNPYTHYQLIVDLLQHAKVNFKIHGFGDNSSSVVVIFNDNIGILFNFDAEEKISDISSVRIAEGIPVIDEPEPWEESNDAND